MTITTSCSPSAFLRRMSWVTNNSASRVLPTRVVPSTSECPTRSPSGRLTSTSWGSMPCRRGRPPTGGSGRTGLKGISQPVSAGQLGTAGTARTPAAPPAAAPAGRSPSARRSGGTPGRYVCISRCVCLCSQQKPAPHEQPLLADRHVAAGHHVARQAADVAPVAQDAAGVAVADRTVGQERQRTAEPRRGSARATTGPPGTETRRLHSRDGIELHRWPQQNLDRWLVSPTMRFIARCRWL